MNQILTRAINSAFWKLLLFGTNFGLNIVLAQTYGASGSAPVFYLLNNLALATLLLSFGLENSVVYFYSKQLTSKKALLRTIFLWSIGATFFFAGVNTITSFLKVAIDGFETELAYIYLFGALLTSFASSFFYAEHRNYWPNLVPGLLNFCFLLFLLSIAPQEGSAPSYVYIKILFWLPLLSGISLFLFQLYPSSATSIKQKQPVQSFFVYSFYVYIATLCMGLFNRIDILIVETQCPPVQLGNYIQANKFGQVAMLIPLMASYSLFPSFVQNMENKQVIAQTVYKVANLYFYLVSLFCIVVNLMSTWLLPWIYGQSFYMMPSLLLLLSPGIIAFATVYPFVSFYSAANNNQLVARLALESLLILVVFDCALIPTLQIYGAAIGYSIANLYFGIRAFFAFQKIKPGTLQQVFGLRLFTVNVRLIINSLNLLS